LTRWGEAESEISNLKRENANSMPQLSPEFQAQYKAFTTTAGLVDLSDRTQIEFTGADRGKFLHNLCTNAVRDLPAGRGCEAFVLDVKGHIVGHVFLFVTPESIVLETVPGQAEKLMAHFDRYLIREDVQLHDRSQEWAELLLSGPTADSILKNLGAAVPENRLDHDPAEISGHRVWLRRVDLAGPNGFLIACCRADLSELKNRLSADAMPCGSDVFETARIEAGTPFYGRDITAENLPQEIERDRLAISFTKGCYLGQETVARIDALGHVNRLLRLVKFEGSDVPPAGAELKAIDGNKSVGHVTSACWSEKFNSPLSLSLIRRGFDESQTKLNSASGGAEVTSIAKS
jgi:tRNA-modifying protein YgfZ